MAARAGRASLDPAAPIGSAQGPPFHGYRDVTNAPIRNAAIQAGAAVGAHAALDAMPDFLVVVHRINLRPAGDSCQTNPHLD